MSRVASFVLHSKRTRWALNLAVLSLLPLSACTSVKVKMGWKVYLDKIPVTSMQASLPKGPGIAPGEKSPLVVTLTQPDGKILRTEGKGQGPVLWKDLTVTASVVTANQKGILSLPRDPRVSDGKVGHVTITAPSHPDLHAELDIPVRYNLAFVSNFSGSNGYGGFNGADGTDGTSGFPGSIDPNTPSPGGDGGNGSDGANGQDGGAGGTAPDVDVQVALRAGNRPLLQVKVSAQNRDKFYLVDPQGGSLTVKADGGQGGSAGKGGRGGRGGSGGIGIPNGQDGRSGLSGQDGSDGPPGRGGRITVTYDPQAKPYLSTFHFSSRNGPSTIFQEERVAPLW